MNIVVDSLMTNYTSSGEGKLVLLLHGWGDSSRGLAAVQHELSQNYQVVAIDLPGFGGSEAPKTGWDLDDYAKFTQNFLLKMQFKQPYAVIGHSNGGSLAIRAISLQVLEPQKLILLASAGIRNSHSTKRLAITTVAKIGNLLTLWLPAQARKRLRKRLYGTVGSDAFVVPELVETFQKVVRQDVQADAATLTLPTLLIYADNDQAVPLSDGRRYHDLIKGSQLEVISSAGHFVHLDQPQTVIGLIKDFLA